MRRLLSGFTLLVVCAACSSDSGPAPLTLARMEGSWNAIALRYVDLADTTNTFDVLTALGVTLTADIRADGRMILTVSGLAPDTSVVTLSGDVMNLNGLHYTVTLNGTSMRWMGHETYMFDVDSDGTDETVVEQADWLRN